MRYTLASIALAYLVTLAPVRNASLQTGMIPVVDTKPASGGALNPCLISGWPMNEGSGRTLHDISGNTNTVTITSISPVWGSNLGFPGSSLTMPGDSGAAFGTGITNFTGIGTPFSLAAWVNVTSTAANQIFASSLTNAGTYNGWELGVFTGGQLTFYLIHSNGSNALKVHGVTNLENTGKHYVVATYDGTQLATGVRLYVDGTSETVNADENDLTLTAASTAPPQLGARPADGNAMTGVEAAVAVYNCVLTPTQVSTYFARGVQVN